MKEALFSLKCTPVETAKIVGEKSIDFAKVIAFDEEGHILTLITADGISLPCDRLEFGDRDIFDTAHRIAWEFANVTLGTLILLNTFEITDTDGKTCRTLVVAARVARKDPMREKQFPRLFLEPEEFLRQYRNEIGMLQDTVKTALQSIPEFQPDYADNIRATLSFLQGGRQ